MTKDDCETQMLFLGAHHDTGYEFGDAYDGPRDH
jgi:hypothetical protein